MANPNPSPETRFGPGESGNPGGKTSEQKRREMRAAELATILRLAELEEQHRRLAEEGKLPGVNNENLRLWKDAEDRGLGAPTQTIDGTVTRRVSPKPISPEEWAAEHVGTD